MPAWRGVLRVAYHGVARRLLALQTPRQLSEQMLARESGDPAGGRAAGLRVEVEAGPRGGGGRAAAGAGGRGGARAEAGAVRADREEDGVASPQRRGFMSGVAELMGRNGEGGSDCFKQHGWMSSCLA